MVSFVSALCTLFKLPTNILSVWRKIWKVWWQCARLSDDLSFPPITDAARRTPSAELAFEQGSHRFALAVAAATQVGWHAEASDHTNDVMASLRRWAIASPLALFLGNVRFVLDGWRVSRKERGANGWGKPWQFRKSNSIVSASAQDWGHQVSEALENVLFTFSALLWSTCDKLWHHNPRGVGALCRLSWRQAVMRTVQTLFCPIDLFVEWLLLFLLLLCSKDILQQALVCFLRAARGDDVIGGNTDLLVSTNLVASHAVLPTLYEQVSGWPVWSHDTAGLTYGWVPRAGTHQLPQCLESWCWTTFDLIDVQADDFMPSI